MTMKTSTLTDFLLARIAERDLFWEVVGEAKQAHPERVRRYRAEGEAMRLIVDLHRPSYDTPGPEFLPYCEGCWEAGGMDGAPTHPCPTIRLVALPYADHPDYDPDWRP